VKFLYHLYTAMGDFNGDGILDVVMTERPDQLEIQKRSIDVFLGKGDGSFQPAVSLDTTAGPAWVSATDLSDDKAPDVVTANPDDNPVGVLLNTTGVDFSLSASAESPSTVSRGQSATSIVSLNLLNAFDNPVRLTGSVQPTQSAPACSISPSSVTFDANGNATATLTINTGATTAWLAPAFLSRPLQFLWLPVAGFALMGVGFGSNRSTRRRVAARLLGSILFAGLTFQVACGGGSGGPGSTNYTIKVTGTSGSTQHSTSTALKVQ
jgi:FG-GAP-like repeat